MVDVHIRFYSYLHIAIYGGFMKHYTTRLSFADVQRRDPRFGPARLSSRDQVKNREDEFKDQPERSL